MVRPQCVWCFIAHPRFQTAVAGFDGQVEVTYRSFELRPGVPTEIDKELQIASGWADRILNLRPVDPRRPGRRVNSLVPARLA